jgi:diguanylate cyclase (GGDEF)-like protein
MLIMLMSRFRRIWWTKERSDIPVLTWLRSPRTAATFLASFVIVSIITLTIGKYFNYLTIKRIVSQQNSKLLINKGLLLAEVDNAYGDLELIKKTLFNKIDGNNPDLFETYQQNKVYLAKFVSSKRSFLSLAWRESPMKRKGLLVRGESDKDQEDLYTDVEDYSTLTIFQPISTSGKQQRSQGLELSLSIAKILNPPTSELPHKKPRCFLILDKDGHTRYDSLTIHEGHDHNHPPLSSSHQETKEVAKIIHQDPEGSYKDSTGSWQWSTIKLNAGIDGVKTPGNSWKLVSHVPPIVFNNAIRGHLFPLGIGSLIIFGLIIVPLSFLSDFINSKRKKLLIQHSWQASHDSLTGCLNRRAGLEFLETKIEESKKFAQTHALLFIDVDHLSQINNSYGHAIGDEALVVICKNIKKSIRSTDKIIRMGGDEFVVSLIDIGSSGNASQVADKILKSCDLTLPLDKTLVPITISIGIAVTNPNTEISNEKIIEAADIAMLEAKQKGRNKITLIDLQSDQVNGQSINLQKDDSPKHRTKSLIKDLKFALANNLLELHYQPIFNKDKVIVCAEALLRLNSSDNQIISPAIFIPIAEQNGLMPTIGHWVIQAAFEQVRQWKLDGFDPPVISINLSTTQLDIVNIEKQYRVSQVVKSLLDWKNLSSKDFKFEITETTTFGSHNDSLDELKLLSQMGFKISIDDFGAGFASLERLRGFPADEIKLDKNFTKNVVSSPIDSSLVKAVTHLAKDLNMELVAEGVESLEQFHHLYELDCDLFQGYLFEKPIPASRFVEKYLFHNSN